MRAVVGHVGTVMRAVYYYYYKFYKDFFCKYPNRVMSVKAADDEYDPKEDEFYSSLQNI